MRGIKAEIWCVIILNEIWQLSGYSENDLLGFACPHVGHLDYRRKLCNNISTYLCIKNAITAKNVELCKGPRREKPGETVLFNSGNLDVQNCGENKYQPFNLVSKRVPDCIFSKSNCEEEGQIIFNNGTPTEDRKCSCDYQKQYKFLFGPANQCFCNPSTEDCTCVQVQCGAGKVVSPDYICIAKDIQFENFFFYCPLKKDKDEDETTKVKVNPVKPTAIESSSWLQFNFPVVLALCSCILFIMFAAVLVYRKEIAMTNGKRTITAPAIFANTASESSFTRSTSPVTTFANTASESKSTRADPCFRHKNGKTVDDTAKKSFHLTTADTIKTPSEMRRGADQMMSIRRQATYEETKHRFDNSVLSIQDQQQNDNFGTIDSGYHSLVDRQRTLKRSIKSKTNHQGRFFRGEVLTSNEQAVKGQGESLSQSLRISSTKSRVNNGKESFPNVVQDATPTIIWEKREKQNIIHSEQRKPPSSKMILSSVKLDNI